MANTNAQTETADSEEVKALKELEELAELRKSIAESERDERAAKLEKLESPISPDVVKSGTAVKGTPIENSVLAHKAMEKAMREIVTDIFKDQLITKDNKDFKNVIVYNETLKSQIIAYQELTLDLVSFNKRFERELKRLDDIKNISLEPDSKTIDLAAVTSALVGTYSLIQAIGSLKSAFNQEKSFTITETSISEVAIVASLFKAVKEKHNSVGIISPSHIPLILNENKGELVKVWRAINETQTKFLELSDAVEKLQEEAKLNYSNEKDAGLKKKRKEKLDKITLGLKKINAQISTFETLRKRLFEAGENKSSIIASSRQIEYILAKLNDGNSFIIILDVTASGTTYTRKSWWVNELKFSGGANISALLFDSQGTLIGASRKHAIDPFKYSHEID